MDTQQEWVLCQNGLAGPTCPGISLVLPVPALSSAAHCVLLLHWFNCNSSFAATSH